VARPVQATAKDCGFDSNVRKRLLFGETLSHDGGVEAFAKLGGNLIDLVPFVDLDGLVGGVEHDAAVLASGGVFANLFAELSCELVVEVVGKMAQ